MHGNWEAAPASPVYPAAVSAKLSAAAAALQALSNPTRLAILAAIADRNQRQVPVVLGELGFDLRVVAKEVGG